MYISKLIIRNFRNFNNASFHFDKGVNTLIGENGSGKTNIFYAMRIILDDSISGSSYKLDENDFNRALNCWKGHWIIINAEFDELDSAEGVQMLSHNIEHMDGSKSGSYSYIFRPKKSIREILYQFSLKEEKTKEELAEILNTITIKDYEYLFTCRGTADFSKEDSYKQLVGDFEGLSFPNPNEESSVEVGVINNTYIVQKDISCTFIKALRDVVSDLRNMKYSPLLSLLKGVSSRLDVATVTDISNSVIGLNNKISHINEVEKVSNGIRTTLEEAVGLTYAPRIDIKSELPDDIDKLMQNLAVWVGDTSDGDYQGKVGELSLGGANLIYLSLKLYEYEQKQSNDKAAHYLLIEEPEAHIHTHIQKALFEKIDIEKTQVFISTHSTHISAASKISNVNILAQMSQQCHVYYPCNGLDSNECKRIERYLDAVRSTLLFAKGVILVEGDAELILVPNMFKKVFGCSLDEIGISLISMSSAVFTSIAQIFHDKRINRRCAIITDLDTSILQLKEDEDQDTYYERACRNSQTAGIRRKEKLDEFCNDNSWVSPFYAKYTFEVDFVMKSNDYEVIEALDYIYDSPKYIEKSTADLKSKNVSIYGKEVLRLAEKVGKGWLALLISEYIFYRTFIPEYILRAIAFAACDHIKVENFRLMAVYRIRQGIEEKSAKFEKFVTETPNWNELEAPELLDVYKNKLLKDDLTKLLKYYEEYRSC